MEGGGSGKTDAEISLGKKTFTVRDWVISGTFKDDELDMIGNIWTKTDSHQWTAENVYALSKGDEVVFTKGGESFSRLNIGGVVGPDGDGVYDRRMIRENYDYEDDYSDEGNRDCELAPGNWCEVLPVGTDVDFGK